MSELSDLAYQIDPARWVRNVLGVEPAPWQEQFLRAPRGASILALTRDRPAKPLPLRGRSHITCYLRRARYR